jgi:trehalose 6-phosphate phosphatase
VQEIGERVARAPHLLLGLDFGGTLAAVVEHPAEASLPSAMCQVLRTLAGREHVSVAIISGRDRADLQARVGIPGLIYAGNHGLEISGPGFIFVEPTAAHVREALQDLATNLAARLQATAGALVEDKGLTLSVHDRHVPDAQAEEVRRVVHAALASTSHPFMLTTGDRVYEIRPRANWTRGDAVAWIKNQLGKPEALVTYLGHDTTDEDAFAAHAEGITVKVDGSSETAARYRLDGPEEVREFLEWLAKRTR